MTTNKKKLYHEVDFSIYHINRKTNQYYFNDDYLTNDSKHSIILANNTITKELSNIFNIELDKTCLRKFILPYDDNIEIDDNPVWYYYYAFFKDLNGRYSIHFSNTLNTLIFALNDDYFLVEKISGDKRVNYLCDSIDGLKNLLSHLID